MHIVFPINILKCNFFTGGKSGVFGGLKEIEQTTYWGIPFYFVDGNLLRYEKIVVLWFSVYNHVYYFLNRSICTEIEGEGEKKLIMGFFPNGLITIWIVCETVSKIVFSAKANDITNYIGEMVKTNGLDLSVKSETLDFPLLFEKDLHQYIYCYLIVFEHWDKDRKEWMKYNNEEIIPELEYIEEALFDGTHDKLHDGSLMKYHQAGKPKKLAIKWHIGKSEYTAYVWFEDEEIRSIFDRFYGPHPETKTDFIIRIDSDKNKYELALYHSGLREPKIMSETAYQLIVFKNKFEYYRSENYNQPRGAWIW